MNAISSDVFCFTHSPKTKEAKRRAVIKGGKASKPHTKEELLPFMTLRTRNDYIQLLEQTTEQLRTPPITYQKAQSMASILNVLIKIKDQKSAKNQEEGFADIIRRTLYPYPSEIQKDKQIGLSSEEYLKILEDVINKLRTTIMTPQKAHVIARLSLTAFEIIATVKQMPAWFMEKVEENRRNQNLTAPPVQ